MKKEIQLGYIHIDSYKSNSSLFPDYWLDQEQDFKEIENNKKEIASCPPDEVILEPNKTWELNITYPTTNPYKAEVFTYESGMTRREVVSMIVKHYKKMYKEESNSTKINPGYIPNMYNRNETDGKYGIWGHDLGDLILHTLVIKDNKLEVQCDS